MVRNLYSFNSCADISKFFFCFLKVKLLRNFLAELQGMRICYALDCIHIFKPSWLTELELQCYSLAFEEYMNNISHNEPMDLIVRYWDNEMNQLAVRYH